MRRRLEQFMQGRYGTDELTKFLMAICLANSVAGEYIYKAAAAVLAGAGADRVLLFPHVFAEYFRAQ